MKLFLSIGFRPFFLGASCYALCLMFCWGGLFFLNLQMELYNMSIFQWHAHELIFGYAGAVIAGFLLTAVKNWTNIETLTGKPLLFLFSIWLLARLGWLFVPKLQIILGVLDLAFFIILLLVIAKPIIKSKQWRQLAITSKLLILIIANGIFYAGSLGILSKGIYFGIYLGLIVEITMILTIIRRIFPVFSQLGLNLNEPLPTPLWIDIASILLSLVWTVLFLTIPQSILTSLTAFMISCTLSVRLLLWYKPGLWKVPLLWSLYVGLAWITIGFALLALSYLFPSYNSLGIHALAYGGMGLITFSMMARVSLGHTGHDVRAKNINICIALILLNIGIVFRVLMPVFLPQFTNIWLMFSQGLWIVSFSFFVVIFTPILLKSNE